MSLKERVIDYMTDSSLFIFHKDSKIRRLCLILAETEENLKLLKDMEESGRLKDYNPDGESMNSMI